MSTVMYTLQNVSVELKQVDDQIFLQERWVYSGSAGNCNLGSATVVIHVQVSTWQGKENNFIEGKRKLGRLGQTNSPWFPLAESLPGKESFFFLLGFVIIRGCESTPSGLPTLFNRGFCLLIVYISPFDQDLPLKMLLIKSQIFQFQDIFVPQWTKKNFFLLGVVSYSTQIKNLLRSYSSNMEG